MRKTKDSRRYKAVKISEKGWLPAALLDFQADNRPANLACLFKVLSTHKVDGVIVPVWIEKVKRRKVLHRLRRNEKTL